MSVDASLFPLGHPSITPGAAQLLAQHGITPLDLLQRHASGDCGDLSPDDEAENRASLEHGYRIFSSYGLAPDARVWVITEADRSATTLLLPTEY